MKIIIKSESRGRTPVQALLDILREYSNIRVNELYLKLRQTLTRVTRQGFEEALSDLAGQGHIINDGRYVRLKSLPSITTMQQD